MTCDCCPLCGNEETETYGVSRDEVRYLSCPVCRLVFRDRSMLLSEEEEKERYAKHENDPADTRYRKFLARLWHPVRDRLRTLSEGASLKGIDFGAGPGPTLNLMAMEDGYPCVTYDPFFNPDREAITRQYAFVTCSEVVEHFNKVSVDMALLTSLVEPGGLLGIMTSRHFEDTNILKWHYREDPTHISFFHNDTVAYVAKQYGFEEPEFVSKSVVLLRKRTEDAC
ncbi:hypothetical protein KIPB_005450 [Kipferlia bialata]|uniref:Uncharacterized protein n=1 Tax=Kipferlia bialata TaxID=797122 RepID=A0A9K3GI76_9EUKA|nr:hypothetical protein KIPB_005450 [Kipferlia bialata]|eukprot:g5450.t1